MVVVSFCSRKSQTTIKPGKCVENTRSDPDKVGSTCESATDVKPTCVSKDEVVGSTLSLVNIIVSLCIGESRGSNPEADGMMYEDGEK